MNAGPALQTFLMKQSLRGGDVCLADTLAPNSHGVGQVVPLVLTRKQKKGGMSDKGAFSGSLRSRSMTASQARCSHSFSTFVATCLFGSDEHLWTNDLGSQLSKS